MKQVTEAKLSVRPVHPSLGCIFKLMRLRLKFPFVCLQNCQVENSFNLMQKHKYILKTLNYLPANHCPFGT